MTVTTRWKSRRRAIGLAVGLALMPLAAAGCSEPTSDAAASDFLKSTLTDARTIDGLLKAAPDATRLTKADASLKKQLAGCVFDADAAKAYPSSVSVVSRTFAAPMHCDGTKRVLIGDMTLEEKKWQIASVPGMLSQQPEVATDFPGYAIVK